MTAIAQTPMTDTFELSVTRINECGAWLRASGELDLAAAGPLGGFLDGERALGRRYARLDVSDVTYLDATCLAVLVHAHHAFLSARGVLILVGVGAHLEHLLAITRLDQVLFYTRSAEDTESAEEADTASNHQHREHDRRDRLGRHQHLGSV